MNWSTYVDYPYLCTEANAERSIVFLIRMSQVVQLEVDAKTLECKELASWYFDREVPEPPRTWVTEFWTRLRAAPSETLSENQWVSSYRTRMDGKIYHWEEDRHECSDFLNSVQVDDGS